MTKFANSLQNSCCVLYQPHKQQQQRYVVEVKQAHEHEQEQLDHNAGAEDEFEDQEEVVENHQEPEEEGGEHQERDNDQGGDSLPPSLRLESLMRPRIRCGIVYTWHCQTDIYGIECVLCEDRPICKLQEFAEHVQIWHQDWQEQQNEEPQHPFGIFEDDDIEGDDNDDELFNELVLRRYVSDDDYAEAQMELDENDVNRNDDGDVSHHEPFEEVLINNEPAEYDCDMQMMPVEETEINVGDEKNSQKNVEEEADEPHESHKPVTIKYIKQTVRNAERDGDNEESRDYHDKQPIPSVAIELSDEDISPRSSLSIVHSKAEPVMTAQGIGLNVNGAYEECKRQNDDINGQLAAPQAGSDEKNRATSSSFSEGGESFEDLAEWRVLTTRSQRRNSNESCQSRKNITQEQIGALIDIYKEHPRLWNQSHPQFSVPKCNRHSWLEVTQRWNAHCKRNFSIHDVRTRVSTLCQRYMKERERLECVGETPRFCHFERMQFLDEQQKQPIQSKRTYYEKLNSRLLEIYQDYPLLWHCSQKHLKCPKEREKALRSISAELKLKGIHFSTTMLTQRLRSLHKWYRDEKRRQLACKASGVTFETKFKHYEQMRFLYKHTDPYVCECGKVFDTLPPYRDHMKATNHEQLHEVCKSPEQTTKETRDNFHEDPMHAMEDETEGHDRLVDSTTRTPTPQDAIDDEAELIDALLEDLSNVEELKENTKEVAPQPRSSTGPQSEDENMVSSTTVSTSQPVELIAKVDCGSFSYELNLNADLDMESSTKLRTKSPRTAQTEENIPKDEESFGRLNVEQTRQMIALYRHYPQLWNPKHLDYQNRKLRRIAWRSLTNQINKLYKMRYSWKTMHRKLSDYVKYYKRESQRMTEENTSTKWCFFSDFQFLKELDGDDIKGQCRLRDKEKSWKIIEVYETFPQLWNTTHEDFSKRRERQGHFEAMRERLKVDHNIELSTDKIRQRLIDYRCNYRMLKTRRLAAEKRNEPFTHQYEFYEALSFLDDHVAPFTCGPCAMTFERFTDFKRHNEKKHFIKANTAAAKKASKDPNNNVCHICGLKFTARSNLVYHLKRHLGLYSHECSVCLKKFYNSTALRVHESSHTKKYSCVCDECGRAFVNMSKLNQHKKRHRNQRDHACDKCDKRFYTAFERDIHLRWHLQIRDKICKICGKGFVVGSSYYAHMLLHRETKRYSCNPCGMQFAQFAGLYKHRKAFHKV